MNGLGVLLELAGPVGLFALLLAAFGRPLLAAVGVLALLGLLLAVDATKRRVLRERLVFSDIALLPQVVRHPQLYLPFLGTRLLAGGLAGCALLLAALGWLEPGWRLPGGARVALLALALGAFALLRWPPRGAVAWGRFGGWAVDAATARRERPARRAAAKVAAFRVAEPQPHVVLVQLESFDDARALPCWAALRAAALAQGRVEVGAFGANTMRAEFAVLTGLAPEALGLDRWHPYAAFARAGVRGLPGVLAAQGYRSVAVHPFDAGFFGRQAVFPGLGFARFDAEAAFGGAARSGRYVSDAALGAHVLRVLREAASPACVFAISIAAHGPWAGGEAEWAARLAESDAMLGVLAAAELGRPLLLAVWGDHQPALPGRGGETRTPWLLWRSDRAGQGARRDVAAHEVFGAVRAALER